jgi:branched-chain amino acid transport system permease protein
MFIATVMYAPGGLAGLIMMHGPIWRAGALSGLFGAYALLLAPIALVTVGAVLLIEMMTHLGVKAAEGTVMKMAGISFDAKSGLAWVLALGLLFAGGGLALLAWRRVVAPAWDRAQGKAREKGLTV